MRIININAQPSQAEYNPDHVYIGRAKAGQTSKYGNPYVIGVDGTRDEVIAMYKDWLVAQLQSGKITAKELVEDLNGKVLECFCAPHRCHGDVLITAVKKCCLGLGVTFIQSEKPVGEVEEKPMRVRSRATETRAHEHYRISQPCFQKGEGETPAMPSL